MTSKHTQGKRGVSVDPKHQETLSRLGENITLAMKRRAMTQDAMHRETGISKPTLRKIASGDPSVSLGHYANVLVALDLLDDLGNVGLADALGRELQDRALLGKSR
jgi:transcriptional regulator with XRE-family HTH domain